MVVEYLITTKTLTTKTKKESTKIQNIFCKVSMLDMMYSFYMFNSLSLVNAK